MSKKRTCQECGTKFEEKGVGTKREKKFCKALCKNRFNSREDYNKKKDKPDYKKERRRVFKNWLSRNRKHFNDLMREKNRIRKRNNYHKFDKLGLCTSCGGVRDKVTNKRCKRCRNNG